MDEWGQARRLFAAWPAAGMDAPSVGTVRRLSDALAGLGSDASGWRDVVTLTHQILLRADALGNPARLPVPLREGLPTLEQWRAGGVDVLFDGERVLLGGVPWAPAEDSAAACEAGLDQVRQAVLGLTPRCGERWITHLLTRFGRMCGTTATTCPGASSRQRARWR